MVKVNVAITATFENIKSLQPQRGVDDPDLPYFFKLQCMNCGEVCEKETCVIMSKKVANPSGKGTTNLVKKCKVCSREGTVTMVPERGCPLSLGASLYGTYITLMGFEFNGLEPVSCSFGRGWKAESTYGSLPSISLVFVLVMGIYETTGTLFEDIDLSGAEFADFCDVGQVPVRVSNVRAQCQVVPHWGYGSGRYRCRYGYGYGYGTRYL
ncbi:hypothetical protein IFM89_022948 [Coptis chinensis]|uniref:CXXC motif containing zinc binding protein n=1 Tax=Coptis chinensis TaxID=261450 RepID=A0A835LNR1_9MAGN|nr:hypothetical protein IFM89_022948 [Coptis chinensis]